MCTNQDPSVSCVLSKSRGLPGADDHPDVRGAIERVRTTCQSAGVPLGIFGLTAAAVRPYIDMGFTIIVGGVDTVMLGNAATSSSETCDRDDALT